MSLWACLGEAYRCVQKKRTDKKMKGVNPPSPPDVNVGVLFRVGTLCWNFGAFFLQHLLDGSLQLTNIEHGGARGFPGGVQGVSGAFFLHIPVPKKLVFFLAHLNDSFKKTPERGEEKSAEERRGEERRGEERSAEEKRGEDWRGEKRREAER